MAGIVPHFQLLQSVKLRHPALISADDAFISIDDAFLSTDAASLSSPALGDAALSISDFPGNSPSGPAEGEKSAIPSASASHSIR